MYKLGIDVGGTNTDAVLIDEKLNIVAELKQATTDDIYSGILSAVKEILNISKIDPKNISRAMLGTTQCTNAIVERKRLEKVAVLRIGAPATTGIIPMVDWAEDLAAISVKTAVIAGGYEYDGKEITALDEEAARDFFNSVKGSVKAVAISCCFSVVRNEHEQRAKELCHEILGDDVHVSLSGNIGSMGLVERENATILNASLYKVAESFTDGFARSLQEMGVTNAQVYISQNDGTLMTMEEARKHPILTIACGPTNSIRGASYLCDIKDAVVVDVGGTTTDVGVISGGFPRESSVAVTIGGVRTNFRMPDVVSIGLGGGSIVREKNGVVTVGPDSVGYKITEKALCFGGDTLTATDIAVFLGMADIGDKNLVANIDPKLAEKAMAVIKEMTEDALDAMKISSDDVDLILVGGGSIILPSEMQGAKSVSKPEHFGTANAIGSAISKLSGTFEQLMNYDETPREQSLEYAKSEAIKLAVASGAAEDSVEIIDMEDVPLSYYPGNTNRVKVKAAGDLL